MEGDLYLPGVAPLSGDPPAEFGHRRLKLTPQLAMELAGRVAEGDTLKDAAALQQITYRTVLHWMQWGERDAHDFEEAGCPRTLYAEFWYLIEMARARYRRDRRRQIELAGKLPEHWQANAWILERTDPDQFGRKSQINVQNSGNVTITVQRVNGAEWQSGPALEGAFTPDALPKGDEGAE
jgi:hypothetical protein